MIGNIDGGEACMSFSSWNWSSYAETGGEKEKSCDLWEVHLGKRVLVASICGCCGERARLNDVSDGTHLYTALQTRLRSEDQAFEFASLQTEQFDM